MKYAEFEYQIERLKRVFGIAKYPAERVDAIFQTIKNLPIKPFEDQITSFIAEREKAPFLKDFVDAFGGLLADLKRQEIEAKLKNESSCYECKDTGASTFYLRENSFAYVFKCHCKRGNIFYPTLPEKFPGMEKIYFNHNEWISGKTQKKFLKIMANEINQNVTKNYDNLRKVDFQKSLT